MARAVVERAPVSSPIHKKYIILTLKVFELNNRSVRNLLLELANTHERHATKIRTVGN